MAQQINLFGGSKITPTEQKKKDRELIKKSQETKKQGFLFNINIPTNTKNLSHNKILQKVELSKKLLADISSEDYEVITDKERLHEYINSFIKNGEGAIDTETCGLNPILDDIAGVCIYTPNEKPAYIPINHVNYSTLQKIPNQLDKEIIKNELKRLMGTKIYWHNSKFDIRVIKWQLGLEEYLPIYWDSFIAGNLLNENEPHGLKYLYEKYVVKNKDIKTEELNTYDNLFSDVPFIYIPLDIAVLYAAKDPYMTYEVGKFQEKYLNPNSKLSKVYRVWNEIERPLIPIVAAMEDEGIPIDVNYAKELSIKYNQMLKDVENEIYEMINELKDKIEEFSKTNPDKYSKLSNPINVGSPTQLGILFYDILGLESPDKEKPRGTGEEILKELNHPIGNKILEYRGIAKLLSTYIDKLPNDVNPKTGKIHANFNQYGAATGRFSSSDPNLQNIPAHNKDIRLMFVAPKGYVLLGGDYSQQEPRTLAFASGDENLIKWYKEGKDVYASIASMVYKVPYEDCLEFYLDENGNKTDKVNKEGKKRRSTIKGIVLGIMYGRGAASIAVELNISKQEAQNIIDTFFNEFPKVRQFVEGSIQHAKDYGYVETVWGRKRRLPDIQLEKYEFKGDVAANVKQNYINKLNKAWGKDRQLIINEAKKQGIIIKDNGGFIAQAERQCVNSIIQGSAADMTKKAMILIGTNEELKKLGYKMLLPVHDEIIGMCPVENALKCKEIVKELMIKAPTNVIKEIPMKVDLTLEYAWTADDFQK